MKRSHADDIAELNARLIERTEHYERREIELRQQINQLACGEIFTLCPKCNAESAVPLSHTLRDDYVAAYPCPHCGASIHLWLRIRRREHSIL